MGGNKTLRWFPAVAAGVMVLGAAVLAYASGGGGGHEAAAASEGGHHGLPWADFIYRCINFAILAGTVIFLTKKPLGQALKNRSEGIKEELADLEAKREEAKKAYAEMEKRLADAAGERDEILADFRKQGEKEYEAIIDSAKTLADRIKAQAQFTIEQETNAAKADLRREVAELSASVAEDLLKQNINADDQSRLVDEYLNKVQQEVQ